MFIYVLIICIVAVIYPLLQHVVIVGGGYTSKSMCSGVFVSKRASNTITENELAGISALLFKPIISYDDSTVTTTFLGLSVEWSSMLHLAAPKAIYISSHFGCQLKMTPDIELSSLDHEIKANEMIQKLRSVSAKVDQLYADMKIDQNENNIHTNECIQEIVSRQFSKEAFKKNQTRGVVIQQHQQIIAEGYQTNELGITKDTKLLGWSMTKSMFSMVIGAAIQQGLLTLDTPLKLNHMNTKLKNELKARNNGLDLTFRELLMMSDILPMEENYGMLAHVVEMLYGSYDAVQFSSMNHLSDDSKTTSIFNLDITGRNKKRIPTDPSTLYSNNHPNSHTKVPFAWYYSSALSNLLSQEFRLLFAGDDESYWEFPHKYLFKPLGIESFAIELDSSGTFMASSFGYGRTRDWLKLSQLLLNNGVLNDITVIPREYIEFIRTPHSLSGGHYGGHFWINPAIVSKVEYNVLPPTDRAHLQNEWMMTDLPKDTYYMSGHDGQNVFIIPSLNMSIVRIGFTHSDDKVTHKLKDWKHEDFYSKIIQCVI